MKFDKFDIIKSIAILLILGFTLLFVLTYSNIVPCKSVGKVWCSAYWGIVGNPKIAIVAGNDGLGNANKLMYIFQDRTKFNLRPKLFDISNIRTTSYLKNYDLVIVTQAKTLSSEQMHMFYSYASQGGILIWTGDAGTSLMPSDKKPEDYNNVPLDQPWIRITDDEKVIFFNQLLSVNYINNFCSVVNCKSNKDFIGNFIMDPNSKIAEGIPPTAQFYGNFAMVDIIDNTFTTMDLSIENTAHTIGKDYKDYGTKFPLIVRSGVGKNVVYLATPIEYMIDVNATNEFNSNFEESNTSMYLPTIVRKIIEDRLGYVD